MIPAVPVNTRPPPEAEDAARGTGLYQRWILRELELYIEEFGKQIESGAPRLGKYEDNLRAGIEYYRGLFTEHFGSEAPALIAKLDLLAATVPSLTEIEAAAAVRSVAGGGWAFDPELVRRATSAKQLGLTERDREVIAGVLAGRSNDEIGADLGISRKTVEAHLSKLFGRFGIGTRVELTGRAVGEEWLVPPTSGAKNEKTGSR